MRNCSDQATHQQPSATGVEGAGGTGGPGCGARGRWRGLAGLQANAPSHTSATRRRRCGGCRRVRRARVGFEIDHSEPLGSRVAISRAAGPDGARNTSGAARNNNPGTPKGRAPKYPPPCRLTQPLPRRGSGRMTVSPGDGDASTGTCRPRRPLPGPPHRSDRRSPCAQDAEPHRYSGPWPEPRARRNQSSRP